MERFLIRTEGGPLPGTRVVSSDEMPWPLPETLPDPEQRGYYRKVSESQLGPRPAGSVVLRGAAYMWAPAVHGPHQTCDCPNPRPGRPFHCRAEAERAGSVEA